MLLKKSRDDQSYANLSILANLLQGYDEICFSSSIDKSTVALGNEPQDTSNDTSKSENITDLIDF